MHKLTLSLFLSLILLVSLTPVQALQEDNRFVQAYTFGETVVSIDATVETPEEILLRTVDVSTPKWTKDKICEVFPEVIKKDIQNYDGYLEYAGSDDVFIACDLDGNFYYKAAGLSMAHAVNLESYIHFAENSGGEIEGYPFEEAQAQVTQLCRKLGVENFVVSWYSAMNSQALTAAYGLGSIDMAPGFTQAPEPPQPDLGYLLYLRFAFDGQTVMEMPTYVNTMGDYTYGSAATVYVTRDGVLMFFCAPVCTLFLADGAVEVAQQAPITLEEAAQALAQHYGMMLGANSMEFDRVTYEYVPLRQKNRRFTLTSAWCFYSADQTVVLPVNAATGQVIR